MRSLIAIAIVALSYDPSRACPPAAYDFPSEFEAAPRGARPNEHGLLVLPARPVFFSVLETVSSDSVWFDEPPIFRRADGSAIAHSGPEELALGSSVRTLRLQADSGVVYVRHPSSQTRAYVIDPSFVPITRTRRFETDRIGRWMWLDTDAVLLRIERRDGSTDFERDTRLVLLSENVNEVTALYADGRDEVLYARPRPCGTMMLRARERREREVAGQLALLLAGLACGIAITRRIRAAGA